MQRASAERIDLHALEPLVVERELQLRDREAVAEPAGEEQADVLLRQAAHRERQGARRGRVQPLDVVDRDQDRLTLREQEQRVADGHREGPDIHRLVRPLSEQKRALERATPGAGQLGQHVRERVLEQVSERRVRDAQVDLARA